ncbi:MAG TPA: B12-binding domain-containing radical SAM protein [Desulfobulbus sp.]|nr:B12-binding domain-containing radical SAM protein [Desulfobulbus sp.]
MKIVCVYSLSTFSLKRELYSPGDIPFGISFIATILKKAGHDVHLVVVNPRTKLRRKFRELIEEQRPALFCLTAVSSQIALIRRVGETIRALDPEAYIIMGGAHPSLNPEDVIGYPFVDAVCRGEGEDAVVALARQLERGEEPAGIANLWIKNRRTGGIEKNPVRSFREDLDDLPFIDREMWEPFISHKKGKVYTILAGRGCPNRCTYCSNHALAQVATGRYVRFRSPDNIIAEIRELLARDDNVEIVFLETETLGANLRYTYALLEKLAEFNRGLEKPLEFGTNLALTTQIKNNRELLEAFRKANLTFFRVGLESGSERIRREVLSRPRYYNRDLIDFCAMCREYDIRYTINILIGLPGETPADFQETIDVTRACQPTFGVSVSIFFPYPGTRLFALCKEQNLLSDKATTTLFERTGTVLNLPDFPSWRIKKEFILFHYKVYRGREPWPRLAWKTVRYTVDAFPASKRFISGIVHGLRSLLPLSLS